MSSNSRKLKKKKEKNKEKEKEEDAGSLHLLSAHNIPDTIQTPLNELILLIIITYMKVLLKILFPML